MIDAMASDRQAAALSTQAPSFHSDISPNPIGADDATNSDALYSHAFLIERHHQGPIPPPHVLEAYERLVPGSAKRIMDWSDEDIRHGHDMEKVVLESVAAERRRGQVCAVVVCVVACATAGYCAHMGAFLAASIIGGSTILGVVAAFLGRRWGGQPVIRRDVSEGRTGAPHSVSSPSR